MPQQIFELKKFMTIVNEESCTSVAVKESNDETKFKAKTTNCQYTFVVKDKAQAKKMKDALGTKLSVV